MVRVWRAYSGSYLSPNPPNYLISEVLDLLFRPYHFPRPYPRACSLHHSDSSISPRSTSKSCSTSCREPCSPSYPDSTPHRQTLPLTLSNLSPTPSLRSPPPSRIPGRSRPHLCHSPSWLPLVGPGSCICSDIEAREYNRVWGTVCVSTTL